MTDTKNAQDQRLLPAWKADQLALKILEFYAKGLADHYRRLKQLTGKAGRLNPEASFSADKQGEIATRKQAFKRDTAAFRRQLALVKSNKLRQVIAKNVGPFLSNVGDKIKHKLWRGGAAGKVTRLFRAIAQRASTFENYKKHYG